MPVSWRKLKKEISTELARYDNVFVMVSGGVDSMVLLDLVRKVRTDTIAIHFRHMIRSSDFNDMNAVVSYTQKHDLRFYSGRGDGLVDISNQEHEARKQRWNFVDDTLSNFSGKSIVLTAHHYDDNLEQYFMASMRGSKNLVMQKLSETEKGYVKYKPLLGVEKADLIYTARANKLEWVEDETNMLDCHERNVIRNKIIPEMMKIRNIRKSMRPLLEGLSIVS
jgi:tRNA(Ile)-lysidine synthetase-like protein